MEKVFMFAQPNQVVFDEEFSRENFLNLASDIIHKRLSKEEIEEGNKVILKHLRRTMGIPEDNPTTKEVLRGMRLHDKLFMEIIIEVVDEMLSGGFPENPFFERFVERSNVADGDKKTFWVKNDDQLLSVAEVARDNHDITLQRLHTGRGFEVAGKNYGAAVGTNIREYLLGRVDFTWFINQLYRSFEKTIQELIYLEFKGIADKIPVASALHLDTNIAPATREQIEDLIENVDILGGSNGAYLFATRKAIRALKGAFDLDWVSGDMKNELYKNGFLGTFNGYPVVQLPQSVKINGNKIDRLVEDDKIYVLPMGEDDRFIKFVNYGEPHIRQVSNDGDYQDDIISFEYTERFGVGAIFSKYMGVITIQD